MKRIKNHFKREKMDRAQKDVVEQIRTAHFTRVRPGVRVTLPIISGGALARRRVYDAIRRVMPAMEVTVTREVQGCWHPAEIVTLGPCLGIYGEDHAYAEFSVAASRPADQAALRTALRDDAENKRVNHELEELE